MSDEPANDARPLLTPLPMLRCCNSPAPCNYCFYCLETARREPEIHAAIVALAAQVATYGGGTPDYVEMSQEAVDEEAREVRRLDKKISEAMRKVSWPRVWTRGPLHDAFAAGWRQWGGPK